ncbi:MAG: hypothetical protein MJ051_04675 [Akkermansia sp.]|nr:hypothetical protein [Akkermansia sp.]
MKKTLFAVAALALCGTAFAETKTYDASDYVGEDFGYGVYGEGSDIVFNVDQTVTLTSWQAYKAASATLSFVAENTLSVSNTLDMEVWQGSGSLAITGDSDAKIHWATALTSADITSVTLASGGTGAFYAPPSNTSFEGLTESGSITLGTATVDYMGYFSESDMAGAMSHITGDNQIALVAISGTKQLALVGKISGAATPEPATATLSLMALAGLCARRRRH